jgi:hypothetical protein
MLSNTFTYRADLGGNYMIHFITTRSVANMPGEHKLVMAILVDNARIGLPSDGSGTLVSIQAATPHEAIETAKAYLVQQQRGMNRLLDEILDLDSDNE